MEKLFTEFKPNSAADWKAQLVKELKGEDYESLRWHNSNGFTVEPFYTSEDLQQDYLPAFTHCDWDIAVKDKQGDSGTLNAQYLRQLNSGASAISMLCGDHDPETALKGIQLNHIRSTFFVDETNAGKLLAYLKKHYDLKSLNATLFCGGLNSRAALERWNSLVGEPGHFSSINTFGFDALAYHNLNCTASYEAGIILSGLVEFLEFFAESKAKAPAFAVKTGVSADYFTQLAKLRAIRRLWKLIAKEYGVEQELHVIAETSLTNKTVSDSNSNLLRTTVEAMAAIGGGCNELVVNEFDTLFPHNSVLSERMAVNQQLILKHESYFDKVADVACGSYYIEMLTDAIAQKALEHFKDVEKQGGYFSCLEKGIFTAEIGKQAAERQAELDTQKQLVVGVNKFRNEKDKTAPSTEALEQLKKKGIHNPALNYELQNFFYQDAQKF